MGREDCDQGRNQLKTNMSFKNGLEDIKFDSDLQKIEKVIYDISR